jgi:UDP:flavonoid glycosyltransferase YjiC (YdhE family)
MPPNRPKILIAPLDWGLGHATRCIPIIKEFLAAGCTVIYAAEGLQKELLQQEFPALKCLDLQGYRVRYSTKRGLTFLKIISQIPKILIQIKRENRWLNNILSRERPDIVVSDNRYGLHSPHAYCVLITHQLHIKTGMGRFVEQILTRINLSYINRFSVCWVPDLQGEKSLAGSMSVPDQLPVIPLRYIGLLSRFSDPGLQTPNNDLVIILSGPEPQRTILESQLLMELKKYKGPVIMVRGLPGHVALPDVSTNISVYNHLPTVTFNRIISQSAIIISRAGYSTIMDLVILGKKSILIPTPGQAEQEWLANHLHSRKIAYAVKQDEFVLSESLEAVKHFPFQRVEVTSALPEVVRDLLETI